MVLRICPLVTLLFMCVCLLRVQTCADADDAMQQLTMQQMGHALNCAQVVLGGSKVEVCDDAVLSGELCCLSCNTLREQYRAEHALRLQDLAEPIERVRALLMNGNSVFRSEPLHGRGLGMPLLAIGTGGFRGMRGTSILVAALQFGYRHFDSAIMYENHGAIRQALEQSGIPRQEVFITSKIPPEMMGFTRAIEAVGKFSSELPGGYADLCLVHWPHSGNQAGGSDDKSASVEWLVVERAGSWRALESAFDAGICRAIGVSNFMLKHLEELERYARIMPSVNQFEYSPLAPLDDLISFCTQRGIVVQGFGWRRPEVLEHRTVQMVAEELKRPASQIVTSWFLQHGWVPLYLSTKLERLLEHAEVMEQRVPLSEKHMALIGRQVLSNYPWRYYTGRYEPAPWNTPVMGEVAGSSSACAATSS